ncbi:MAG: hypothetical protein EZS28_014055 [Streblomastix strix]|uniref:Sm domain-containing protein n=1 Tax=Streblomastix strix TaxID=222440 RepID=A0A5J4W6D2_9EUKA|nr:MAG: hypothetical protein EZS28_014055 [Streblomastix strix]
MFFSLNVVQELDKRVVTHTRDNKIYIGWLRSFDAFTNLVLEGAVERLIVKNKYAEIPLGLLFIRGETISTISQLPPGAEALGNLQKAALEDIILDYKEEQERARRDEFSLREHLADKGLTYEGQLDESWSL